MVLSRLRPDLDINKPSGIKGAASAVHSNGLGTASESECSLLLPRAENNVCALSAGDVLLR
jgi:hypothetical protein